MSGLMDRWVCRACGTRYVVWSLARQCEVTDGWDGEDVEGWS
jgi:hypothetical protein